MTDASVESSYVGRVGYELDVMLNVVFLDGENGQSVSTHSADAMAAGKTWGCVLCKVLSALVQRNHCELVLTNQPTPMGAAVRALVLIVGVFALVGFGIHEAISYLF